MLHHAPLEYVEKETGDTKSHLEDRNPWPDSTYVLHVAWQVYTMPQSSKLHCLLWYEYTMLNDTVIILILQLTWHAYICSKISQNGS